MSGALYQPIPTARRRTKVARQPLLSSCAVAAALVAAGHGMPVRAQSYIADVASTTNATVRTGPGTTFVTVDAPTAIVNWTPTNTPGADGVIAFQNAGTDAIFESTGADYAVLNRIVPTAGVNPISFSGTTTSYIGSSDGGPIGGAVWFYSPGGIIVGSSAVFDVGSLGLSTANITDADFLDGNNNFSFLASPDSRAQVTLMPGAQVNALNEGSYVAIVSPRIDQGGTVTVNGSAAYVAAEAADITINGGLFNIAVQTGSVVDAGGETTLSHSGTTTGAAPASGSDPQAIYMVAMPKNDAVTMLVSGTVGYAPAVSAGIENGTVVLAAGRNVQGISNGFGGVVASNSDGPAAEFAASLTISDATIDSRLEGLARTDAAIVQGAGTTSFASSLFLTGGASASITGQGGALVTVGGDATLSSPGGMARIDLTNATLQAEGDVSVSANAIGADGSGANAQGGTAAITLVDSLIETNRTSGFVGLSVAANGVGGSGPTGGNGTGGSASISADDSGITVGTLGALRSLTIGAAGSGGDAQDGGTGGAGQGGTASFAFFDSTPDGTPSAVVASNIDVSAGGFGGGFEFGYGSGTGGNGGSATGGTASLTFSAGTLGSSQIGIFANALGGSGNDADSGPDGGDGGDATGGTASLTVSGGTFDGTNIFIGADGEGGGGGGAFEFGYGASGAGGDGGDGAGGTATATFSGGVTNAGFLAVGADGVSGGGGFSSSASGGSGGDATGGTALTSVTGGTANLTSSLFISALGEGQSEGGGGGNSGALAVGGVGGSGVGGTARLTVSSGSLTTGFVTVNSTGGAGDGGTGTDISRAAASGAATGGTGELLVEGGSFASGGASVLANADGEDDFADAGGDAQAGTARIAVSGGAASFSSSVTINASAGDAEGSESTGDAFGGTAELLQQNGATLGLAGSVSILATARTSRNASGTAGSATGGSALLTVEGSSLAIGSSGLTLSATAYGADATVQGGHATGGTAAIMVADGDLTFATALALEADGIGGDGFSGGSSGNGTGGSAMLAANGGTITFAGALTLSAAGVGGFTDEGGDGGIGQGGTASILSAGGVTSPATPGSISLVDVTLDASGTGGDAAELGYGFGVGGGDGGAGIGGTASFEAINGAITGTGSAAVAASGSGGAAANGGSGGGGTGGTASIVSGGDANGVGLIDFTALAIDASGTGTSSFELGYGIPVATGGNGGAGMGGAITLGTAGGALTLADGALLAFGSGGSGGLGTSIGGAGGAASGGSVTITAADSTLDLSSTTVIFDISANGGDGGAGGANDGPGGTGGAGGAATGGAVFLNASGEAGALTLDPSISFSANIQATGGSGGNGGSGTTGGRGGDGGSAIGARYDISTNLGSLTIAGVEGTGPSLSVTGSGGDGGTGGDGSDVGDTGGDGGNGGSGMGGVISVAINGGSANFGFTEFFAHGNGGFAGGGGFGADAGGSPTTPASGGIDGRGRGGTVSIAVDDNSGTGAAGAATFSDTLINVGGFIGDGFDDIGGRIEITDTGVAAGGGIEFASLTAVSTGLPESSDQATGQVFDLFSVERPINVLGAVDIDVVGNVARLDNIVAGGDIEIDAGYDPAALDDDDVVIASSSVNAGTVTSTGGEIDIEAVGAVSGGDLSAGHELSILSLTGGVTLASAAAGTLDVPASADNNRSIGILAAGDVAITGGATAAIDIGLGSVGGSINAGSLDAGRAIVLLAGNAVNLGAVTTTDLFYVANSSMLPLLGTGPDDFDAANLAGLTPVATGGAVTITGPVDPVIVAIAGNGIVLADTVTASENISLISTAGIDANALVSGNTILATATDALSIASADAGGDIALSADTFTLGNVSAGGDVAAASAGAITTGDIEADGLILLNASNGAIQAGNLVSHAAAGGTRFVAIGIETGIGDATVAGAVADFGDIDIDVGGGITAGALSAGDSVRLLGDLDVTTGALTGGTFAAGASSVDGYLGSVGAATFGSIGVASATALNDIGFVAGGSLTTGVLDAGRDIGLTATGDIAIASASAGRAFYVGNASIVVDLGLDEGLSLEDLPTILATTPIATEGNFTVVSAVDAESIRAAIGGNVSTRTLTAVEDIDINAGGDILVSTNIAAGGLITAQGAGVTLNATGPLTVDSITATDGSVRLTSGGAIAVRATDATGSIMLTASGAIDIATDIAAGGGIALNAQDGITTLDLLANNSVRANSANAFVDVQQVESVGGSVRLSASDTLSVGDVRAAGSIFLTGAGAITAGDLTAGTGPLLPGEQGGGSTDPALPGIAPGFDGFAVPRCDDCFTSTVALPFEINYFGTTYSSTFVSTNGYLTFNTGQGQFTPAGLGEGYFGQPIIAPYFADVDTRNFGSAPVTYGAGTFAGRQAFGATWNGVGYFSNRADKLNNFQLIITDRSDTGAGNFDIYYNYTNITWETGGASGGVNGFGGTSAAVGYNAGTGNQPGSFFELPGSRVPGSFLNTGPAPLITGTNNGNPGQLLFSVRNGLVLDGGASEPPTIHVNNIAATGGNADITLGNLSAEAVEVHGAAGVTVGNVDVGDRESGIEANGLPFATVLDATTTLQAGDIAGAGFVALGAELGDLAVGAITTPSSVTVLAGGAIILGPVSTGRGEADSLFISNPSIHESDPALAGFSFETLLGGDGFDPNILASLTPVRTGGALTLTGPVSTGNFLAAIGSVTPLGAIDASNRVFVDSASTLSIDGAVRGLTIDLASPDIEIGSAASIGAEGTASLSFTNNGTARTFIGGSGDATAYALSNAEFGRLSAHEISIFGPAVESSGNAADLLVHQLDIIGSAGADSGTRRRNLTGSQLNIRTAGSIDIEGAVTLTSAGVDDTIFFDAGERIRVITPSGSIAVTGAQNALAGRIAMAADTIFVGSQQAAQDIAALGSTDEIDERLGTNDGAMKPEGHLQANTLEFSIEDALYIQNSGGPGLGSLNRAGFMSGSGGVAIATGESSDSRIIINGRQSDGSDGFVTGKQIIPLLSINGTHNPSGGFDLRSTANGCLIVGQTCRFDLQPTPPVQDVIGEIVEAAQEDGVAVVQALNLPLVQLVDYAGLSFEPLIDEPVTGAGNDDLWFGDEEEPEEDEEE